MVKISWSISPSLLMMQQSVIPLQKTDFHSNLIAIIDLWLQVYNSIKESLITGDYLLP